MEEKDGEDSEPKSQETGADAPGSPQEQSGLVVVIGGQIMVLATPAVQDFVWVDVITGGTPATVLERAKAKGDLVDILLSRSNLTSEQIDVLNIDSLVSKRIIGSVLMQKLFGQTA